MSTSTQTAVEELFHHGIRDVAAYADDARHALRTLDPRSGAWRRAYERGLAEAYRRKDMEGLAEIALVAIARLQAEGHHDDALAYVRFAIAMARDAPEQAVRLLCMNAFLLAVNGSGAEASQTLDMAKRKIAPAMESEIRAEYQSNRSLLRCLALDSQSVEDMVAPIPLAERLGHDWLANGLKSWLIPWLFAVGRRAEASPWIDSLRVQADVVGHQWRRVDAAVFGFASNVAAGSELTERSRVPADLRGNYVAAWRLAALEVRRATYLGDWVAAEEGVRELRRLRERALPGTVDGADAYEWIAGACRPGESMFPLPTPHHVSLVNLGSALAGMEAVAVAGSQSTAGQWHRWATGLVPPHVRTSLEWPVARDRVTGLLHVRAGDTRAGISSFREGIRWADEAGYDIEAGMGRVQLAEVLALGEHPSTERHWSRVRHAGWEALERLGIDPTPHAYAATRALALSRAADAGTQLTPREAEVLSLLADGLTYRQTAAQLGVQWRTVQTHAYHVYEKLDVHGRVQAITAARKLGIL